jgi:predicted nucleotidyltransferase
VDKIIGSFVEELKKRPDVIGIILFGSWARGNNRPDSDIDLMVITIEEFRRTVEYKDNRAFEITYTTEKSAMDYWESHKNDCAGLWEVAKILYDKDGTIKKLEEFAQGIIKKGKNPLDEIKIGHLKFDAKDSLEAVKALAKTEPVLANFLLTNKIFWLTELFFDIRQLWVPAPKQRFDKIKEIDKEFFDLLTQFYQDGIALTEKIKIAEKTIPIVFKS